MFVMMLVFLVMMLVTAVAVVVVAVVVVVMFVMMLLHEFGDLNAVLDLVGYFLNNLNDVFVWSVVKVERFCGEYEAHFLEALCVRDSSLDLGGAVGAVESVHN